MEIEMTIARSAVRAVPTLPTAIISSVAAAAGIVDREGEQSKLSSIGAVCRFRRNATIFSDGGSASCSYKVVSGVVRLVKLMADGRRQILNFEVSGDLFGIEWTKEYAVTAEAVTDVVALRYQRSRLELLSEECAEVHNQLMDRLRRDLCSTQNHLLSLGCQTANERVASFLLLHARRAGRKDGETMEMPMGRQDVADYLGLTIETVCRTLSELKAEGVIAIPNRHEIVIRSGQRLRAIVAANA